MVAALTITTFKALSKQLYDLSPLRVPDRIFADWNEGDCLADRADIQDGQCSSQHLMRPVPGIIATPWLKAAFKYRHTFTKPVY